MPFSFPSCCIRFSIMLRWHRRDQFGSGSLRTRLTLNKVCIPHSAELQTSRELIFTGWYLLDPWRIALSILLCYCWRGGEGRGGGRWGFHQWVWVLPDFAACQTDPNKTVWLFCGHQRCSGCAASDCSALVALCLAVWYSWGMALLQLLLGALWHRHRLISWHWHCSLWNQMGRREREKKNIIRQRGILGERDGEEGIREKINCFELHS